MSLVIALFGFISLTRLQNRELPAIDPPVVSVTTIFPGAAPEVVETSVTDPLEDQVNGIEGVKHVISISREQVSIITIEFELSRDLEAATNDVRDRVSRARRDLPEEVNDPVVAKRDSDSRAVIWLALSGELYDQVELTSIADKLLVDQLSKQTGVASVIVGGERRFAMRVWLDNRRLAAHNLTTEDVAAALLRENVDIPSGRLESSNMEFTVRSQGELKTVEGFENLIVANVSGSAVRLRDLAQIEVGAESVRKLVRYNGVPAIGLGVVKQSTANTLDVADAVKAELADLQRSLPPGATLEIAFDGSRFIRQSIRDVTKTIFEAIILVVLVIYIFLRSFRATLIPALAIPVSILGAFAFLYFAGFTINTLTLLGITLAIGLVVDDAIVVLENITRWMEQGTPPLEAAQRGMNEISFAVVAATVSAVAVFLPLSFLTDTTGRLFREFAVTVAAALAVSGFVAVTLSPALCALVVRRGPTETGIKGVLARMVERVSSAYGSMLRPVLRRPGLFVGAGFVWLGLGVVLWGLIDEELIPKSDRGYVLVWTQAPEGSTIEYMDRYQKSAEELMSAVPEVDHVFSIIALGLGTPGLVNQGLLITSLSPVDQRERDQEDIAKSVRPQLGKVAGIKAFASTPSALSGFMASPVAFAIEGEDLPQLAQYAAEIEQRIDAHGGFGRIQTNLYLNKPQLEVEIDRDRASDLGVSVRSIATSLQTLLGGLDLSTFKLDGETYNVMVQVGREERNDPRDILEYSVRGNDGLLIPLSSLVKTRESTAPREIPHYNRQRSVTVSIDLEKGDLPQGEAIQIASSIARDVLPEDYRIAFTGEAEKFIESGNSLAFAYVLAILVVYLVLAAQFESFVHPITILVAVAFSFTGALVALLVTATLNKLELIGLPGTLNLYSKIGLVMLVGLVTKNSILIVEFANQLRDRGLPLAEAISQASQTRFRPILMTALATMVGIAPIAVGSGAGGDSRAPLGIAVSGGMFFSTLLTFFIVPATYLTIERAREGFRSRRASLATPAAVAGGR
jgi:multidrug efflux pump